MKLPYHIVLRVSVIAKCDPRSVVAYTQRRPLRGTLTARIEAALGTLGIVVVLSEGPPDSS